MTVKRSGGAPPPWWDGRAAARSAASLLLAGLVAAVALGASCSERTPPQAPPAAAPSPAARLILLTDLDGKLEPCGCTSRPLGGVHRLVGAVRRLGADGVPTAVLSCGDTFFGREGHDYGGVEVDDAARQVTRWRAETLGDALGLAGLRAFAPGPEDLRRPDAVERVAGDARPVTGDARVLSLGDLRVGVVGLAADAADPLVAVRDALAASGADRWVVLAAGGRQQASRVARGVDGVDLVVVAGLDRADPIPPGAFGSAHVLHAGREGQGFVVVELFPGGDGPLRDASPWSREVERTRAQERLAGLRQRLEREPDSAVLAERIAEAEAEVATLGAAPPPPGPGSFVARWVPLDHTVEGDAQAGALLDALDRRVNEHNRVAYADRAPPPVPDGAAAYAGSASCGVAGCHAEAYAWWQRTPHGRAYPTLVEDDKQFHLDCVGCHVTGYERPGGSTVTHLGPDGALRNVGCESCHGPGSLHNADPEAHGLVEVTPESTCVGCHNEEHSDTFVYLGYKAMLLAPGHGLPLPGETGTAGAGAAAPAEAAGAAAEASP